MVMVTQDMNEHLSIIPQTPITAYPLIFAAHPFSTADSNDHPRTSLPQVIRRGDSKPCRVAVNVLQLDRHLVVIDEVINLGIKGLEHFIGLLTLRRRCVPILTTAPSLRAVASNSL